MAMNFVQESELWEAHRGQIRTLTWRRISYGGNGGENLVDSDGDQRQEALATTTTIRRPRGWQQWGASSSGLKKFSNRWVRRIYTHVLSVAPNGMLRWHRDAKLRAVSATRLDQVILIGITEMKT